MADAKSSIPGNLRFLWAPEQSTHWFGRREVLEDKGGFQRGDRLWLMVKALEAVASQDHFENWGACDNQPHVRPETHACHARAGWTSGCGGLLILVCWLSICLSLSFPLSLFRSQSLSLSLSLARSRSLSLSLALCRSLSSLPCPPPLSLFHPKSGERVCCCCFVRGLKRLGALVRRGYRRHR